MDINKLKQNKSVKANQRFPITDFSKQKSIKELLEFGIINIDKSSGPTSFDVSDFVRKKLGLRKTSHFGTLDPKVTGVLPVALNRACKLTGYFLGEDKEYIGVMRIHEDVSLEKIKKVIKEKFTGKIKQTPPVKSRVKRQEREREIKRFELLEIDGMQGQEPLRTSPKRGQSKDILFHAEVQGGTYIRKLISDLGDYMKIGAHMLELRRIRACIFKEDDKEYPGVNLYDFENAVDEYEKGNEELLRKIIIPAEIVSELFPVIEIKKESVDRILHGQPLYNKNLVKKYDLKKEQVVVVFCENKFVGMFKIINGKDIFATSLFVLQEIKE
ncbi:RNA-guided pseudouridylation complex pseudouridine synthase subunit Cbf5 [Candidatus Pacearchaeota archaeon]|nr:RNA-guided pseudouridylation complex pseudouridine synthase subunit Cbf5 [Candidatus Pacearchaeota archaeon]